MGKKVYVALVFCFFFVFFFFFVMVLGVTDVVAGVLHRVGYSYYQFILCGDHMRQLSEALMCTDPGSMCPDLWGRIR